MTKSQLLNIRVQPAGSELKHALAQQQREGHTQPQRITPTDYHRHICALTIKNHTQQSLANNAGDNVHDPPSGHREDVANGGDPLQALGSTIFSSRLAFPAHQLNRQSECAVRSKCRKK